MQPETRSVLDALLVGAVPKRDSLRAAVLAVMDGRCSPIEIAALLTVLAAKGETADQLAGAAQAMREKAARITTRRTGLLDTCGTGGDRLHTFNISTAAALVAAAAGVPVAKHGNRAASSASGSADVLEALGVNVSLSPEQVGRCLDEVGIGFCFARVMHTAMKHVAPVRAELGFRTIFNLLGPLTNPAGAEYQLIGASRVSTAEKLAQALSMLGTRRAFVVCGADQLDEVALWGETTVLEVAGDVVQRRTWSAATFHLPECAVGELQVEGPQQSAAVIRSVLQEGQGGARRDMIAANAAAALVVAGAASSLREGVEMALSVIASGAAGCKLEELAAWTAAHGPSS
jgi:anthranilate phosphoribosyltransferase